MKRMIAMVLLTIGIGLAAAYGARNGDQHTEFRAAQWAVGAAENDGRFWDRLHIAPRELHGDDAAS